MSSKVQEEISEAEALIAELFRNMGYRVRRRVFAFGIEVDMIVEKDELKSPVEVKIRHKSHFGLQDIQDIYARFMPLVQVGGYVAPIICVFGRVSGAAKEFAKAQPGFRIWDIYELRERARPYHDVYQKFGGASGDKPLPKASKQAIEQAQLLIGRLVNHESDAGLTPQEYESLCQETAAFLFDPHLYGFERQTETSDGGNRYDFICRIKPGDPFWDGVRADFRTRAILFECKNYAEPITADQIYSTERYLFSRSLRTVCVLVSRRGPDDSAKRAAQGAMRESGKLILLVSNADLVRMLKLKEQGENPTLILDEMIWDFIIKLPR
ncbi:hypothetical protein XH89_15840 [Bradyrhizobium sp. CCBAU 53340]|uniref:restriction endonuclease n=1 Tax=Bradyrhizobium sp. CCBAU 53340 TaxID=1325112 RepID=UPI00188CCB69|nr:restriction endonuclease [Bradyrhizobium sp. CCBAU 53340]QOZ44782.1 hypothetical protein XH89_15840 [Bradyrhizobium sp. CCBAU 53340]